MITSTQTDVFPDWKDRNPRAPQCSMADKGRIGEAVRIIRKVGGEKVGFLGLAFKEGAEDFRESPILEVMKTLVSKGHEVIAYEPTIDVGELVDLRSDLALDGELLRDPSTHLFVESFCERAANVVDGCETLVVTYHTKELQKLIASRCGRCNLIDFIDLFSEQSRTSIRHDVRWCH